MAASDDGELSRGQTPLAGPESGTDNSDCGSICVVARARPGRRSRAPSSRGHPVPAHSGRIHKHKTPKVAPTAATHAGRAAKTAAASGSPPPGQKAPVRTTRETFKRLVAELDAVLRADLRSAPRPNGAGPRSLGNAGRSSHDVLADVVRSVAALRSELDQQCMLRSSGAVTVEVETSDWTITAMSPGAEIFFKDAPWGSMMGQSLTDLVKWEDLDALHSLMSSAPATAAVYDADPASAPGSPSPSPETASSVSEGSIHESLRSDSSYSSSRSGSAAHHHRIRLMHFASVDLVAPSLLTSLPPVSADAHIRDDATVQGCHAARQSRNQYPSSRPDVHDDQDQHALLLPQDAADGWSDAFAHDPMLCDPQEANNGGSPGCLHGKYVETSIQVLHVAAASPTETPRALVAISLL